MPIKPTEEEHRIMFRNPVENYKFWDDAEIDVLEHYMMLFGHNHIKESPHPWYMDNWLNCEKAILYLRDHIASKYLAIDKSMPLKRAIKEGKVIRTHNTLSEDAVLRLVQLHESGTVYQQLDETLEDYVIRKMKANEIATITKEQYSRLKHEISDANKGLFLELQYSHLTIYTTTIDPREWGVVKYDPAVHGRDCVPSEYAPYF